MKKLNFQVIRHPSLTSDLQEIIGYYNERKAYLGNEFYYLAVKQLKTLEQDALLYQIRYEDIRCLQVPRFPFMIHYSIDFEQNKVYVHGIINTSRDSNEHWKKKTFE
jgi:hypothetical protein